MLPDDPRHGTKAGYRAHRRAGEDACALCRAANARYKKQIIFEQGRGTSRKRPARGVQRRVRALQRLGWSLRAISRDAGLSPDGETLRSVLDASPDSYVYRPTFDAIAASYDRLSMTLPAPSSGVTRARNHAQKNGWPPPLAWDDIDDPREVPAAGHQRRTYAADEMAAEWDFLRRSGLSMEQAAERLGVHKSAIEKALERVRKVA